MNLHEYQAKSILRKYGVETPVGLTADNPEQAVAAAKELQRQTEKNTAVNKILDKSNILLNRNFLFIA